MRFWIFRFLKNLECLFSCRSQISGSRRSLKPSTIFRSLEWIWERATRVVVLLPARVTSQRMVAFRDEEVKI